jgi:hypothetical protein
MTSHGQVTQHRRSFRGVIPENPCKSGESDRAGYRRYPKSLITNSIFALRERTGKEGNWSNSGNSEDRGEEREIAAAADVARQDYPEWWRAA